MRTPNPSSPGPVRIAILGTRGIPARYGGFETFAERLSLGLARLGVDVTVFCPRDGSPQPARYRGVQLAHVRPWGKGTVSTLLYDLSCLWRARRDYDVVYMLGYASSPFCILPRLFGKRVWINMDGIEWRRSKWRGLARLWLRATEAIACRVASRLIFDNRAVADDVTQRNGRPSSSSVIAYGAELDGEAARDEILAEHGLTPGEYYLAVCRFEPENQVREMIHAYERSRSARPLILVTGDSQADYARETRALAGERVRFIGSVYDAARLFTLRRHCRAYLHGHSVGGTNPSLLESMACGSLVVAHDNPFNREVLGSCGRWFAREAELTEQLDEVDGLSSAALAEEGTRARQRIVEVYTWEKIVAAYAGLLGVGTAPEAELALAAGERCPG